MEHQDGFQNSETYEPEFPSFKVVLRRHNFYKKFVYIPAQFALRHLDGQPELIKLETLDGRQWPAKCFSREGLGCGKSTGEEGWATFSNDNDLQEGDVCLFELINTREIVFKVKSISY